MKVDENDTEGDKEGSEKNDGILSCFIKGCRKNHNQQGWLTRHLRPSHQITDVETIMKDEQDGCGAG